MARIVVTGDRGYLGQSVVHRLVEAGHDVAGLTGRLADLAPRSVDADCVVHAAAALRDRPAAEIRDTNVEGTRALLRGLRPGTRIAFISSRAIYGTGRPPLVAHEETPPAPRDVYGTSKLEAERLVVSSGHPFVIFRPTVIFGTGRTSKGRSVVDRFVESARRGEPVHVHGGGQLIDPVYVDDVARHVAAFAGEGDWWGEVFNVAGARVSVLDMALLIVELTAATSGRRSVIDITPVPEPDGVLLDASKLASWSPHRKPWSLDDVIQGLIARS